MVLMFTFAKDISVTLRSVIYPSQPIPDARKLGDSRRRPCVFCREMRHGHQGERCLSILPPHA